MQTVKMLKSWGMKFTRDDKEDGEEFLEKLEDCQLTVALSDGDLIDALPCILDKRAAMWYRTIRPGLRTWAAFTRTFRI